MKNCKKGFTLIELLVVVLIIGILAAIALPQYRVAVTKSKFAALKSITKSILESEDRYYLVNNVYTGDLSKLDVDIGGSVKNISQRNFDWGHCSVALINTPSTAYVRCFDNRISMLYQLYLNNKDALCVYDGSDTSSPQYKVCQQETGKITPYGSPGEYVWYY
ncbi:MAG: prepilin-type N-terminal cleavage/methylation domain-containing protein [Elusimicrobiaceae bacterium]|nr:prepilin-type N-terminal cleavage/methylation domain-containing protein [Elusimicrobiaceae bacterium]